MTFIDHYLKEYSLDEIPASTVKHLEALEKEIIDRVDFKSTFDTIVTKYGHQIADIIERFAKHWKNINGWSFLSVFDSLRFVINIGVEVKQLVDLMRNDLVTDDMTAKQKKEMLKNFAIDLIYFIWKTVDPLQNHLKWLPFKQNVERWLVRTISMMAISFAEDLIKHQFGTLSVGNSIRIRTL
jgi:hypothetical protein